jgi:hypothetical protein
MKRILLVFISMILVHTTFAQWSAMSSGPGGTVRALCVHRGQLYAGGDFTGLVKRWDGATGTWVSTGSLSGTSTPKVYALISYNNELYAGGSFSLSSSNFNVARWNEPAGTWVAVGSGLQGTPGSQVKAFCIYLGSLIAGGTFTQSGVASVSKVAKFNGTAWEQVGPGAPPNCTAGVYAMSVHSSELHVGGEGSAPWVNKLNISTGQWVDLNTLGELTQGQGVYALNSFRYNSWLTPSLFIGGAFDQPFKNCTQFSSGQWGTVLNPFTGTKVNCFVSSFNSADSTGYIYAGGSFAVNGATNIAKRPIAGPWSGVGTEVFNGGINALCFWGGNLIAGGDFTSPTSNLARFGTTIGVEETKQNVVVNNVFPNPVIKDALLRVQTIEQMQQPELRMMDANGNEVSFLSEQISFNHSSNEVEYKISSEGLAAGLYYYVLIDKQQNVASGKLIIE